MDVVMSGCVLPLEVLCSPQSGARAVTSSVHRTGCHEVAPHRLGASVAVAGNKERGRGAWCRPLAFGQISLSLSLCLSSSFLSFSFPFSLFSSFFLLGGGLSGMQGMSTCKDAGTGSSTDHFGPGRCKACESREDGCWLSRRCLPCGADIRLLPQLGR